MTDQEKKLREAEYVIGLVADQAAHVAKLECQLETAKRVLSDRKAEASAAVRALANLTTA